MLGGLSVFWQEWSGAKEQGGGRDRLGFLQCYRCNRHVGLAVVAFTSQSPWFGFRRIHLRVIFNSKSLTHCRVHLICNSLGTYFFWKDQITTTLKSKPKHLGTFIQEPYMRSNWEHLSSLQLLCGSFTTNVNLCAEMQCEYICSPDAPSVSGQCRPWTVVCAQLNVWLRKLVKFPRQGLRLRFLWPYRYREHSGKKDLQSKVNSPGLARRLLVGPRIW